MRALTVKTEFAYLIAFGVKTEECRNWKPKEMGKILIHSANDGGFPYVPPDTIPDNFWEQWDKAKETGHYEGVYEKYKNYVHYIRSFYNVSSFGEIDIKGAFKKLNFACKDRAIVGEVTISEVNEKPESILSPEGWKYYWKLENPVFYTDPVFPIKGKQGLWEVTQ